FLHLHLRRGDFLLHFSHALLGFGRAHANALHDAEHPLIHFTDDLLALFRRELRPLFLGRELAHQLEPDRHQIDLDVARRVWVGRRWRSRRRWWSARLTAAREVTAGKTAAARKVAACGI